MVAALRQEDLRKVPGVAETLKAKRAGGVAAERLARLKAPAGLDLGAITPDEIALSILAEIVALRRGKHPRGGEMA